MNPEKLDKPSNSKPENLDSGSSTNVIVIDLDNQYSHLSNDSLSCCSTTSEYPRLLTPTKHKRNSYSKEQQTNEQDLLGYVEPERTVEPERRIEPVRKPEPVRRSEPQIHIEPFGDCCEPCNQVDGDETKQADTEFDLFGRVIGCQLKKLPEVKALKSMARIQSYIVKQRLTSASDSNLECMHCAAVRSYSKPACRTKGGKHYTKCPEPAPRGCFCGQSDDTSSSLFSDGSDLSPIVSCCVLDD